MAEKKKQSTKRNEPKDGIKGSPQKKAEPGDVAGGVLQGLDDVIPGLGRMLDGLRGSEAFKERLEAINKEVDNRLREAPLKRGEGEGKSRRSIPGKSLIPKVEGSFSIRSLAEEKPAFEIKEEKPKRATGQGAARPQPAIEKEVLVDIFEDATYLKIIAELPGVQEKNVKVELNKETVVISANTPYHKYYKEVALPCPVKGEPKTSCKNGILEIELEKED